MTSIEKPDSTPSDSDTNVPPAVAPDSDQRIGLAVEAALERKADHILVLDLDAISDFTERFLICNGSNERQVQAIADAVLKTLRDEGMRPLHVEGLQNGRWILLDYGGEMVIHIFLDEAREFYEIERLWSDAPNITSRFVQ